VVAVAVSRFHDDEIGLLEEARIANERLVPLADVARKDDPPRVAVLGRVDLDHGRAEDMTRVEIPGHHARHHFDRLAGVARAKQGERAIDVGLRIKRFIRVRADAPLLAVPLLFVG
jgi:hypothetical protein